MSRCLGSAAAIGALVLSGLALFGLTPADAQTNSAARADSVEYRPRPEFDPLGFELDRLFTDAVALGEGKSAADPEAPRGALSSFVVLPRFELETFHTDNLFRTADDTVSDFVTVARPGVRIESDWDNHALGFQASAGIGRHRDFAREDFEDYRVALNGAVTVDEFSTVSGLVTTERNHEQRGTLDDPGQAFGPTFYNVHRLELAAERRVPDGVLIQPSYKLWRYRFEENGDLNNTDRDRDEHLFTLRLGFEFVPGTTVFVQPHIRDLDYRLPFDRSGVNRDAQVYEFLVGATWDTSPVTFLEAGIGYIDSRFDDEAFDDVSKPSALLKLIWNATPLLTLNSGLHRLFEPTTEAGYSGTLKTIFDIGLDWEARYNLLVGVGYSYLDEEFLDSTPNQERQSHTVEMNARWLINEYFFALGRASHETRSGESSFDSLDETKLLVSIGGHL